MQIKNFKIRTAYPDNLVQLNDGHFFQVSKITCKNDELNDQDFVMEGFFVFSVGKVFKKPINLKDPEIHKIKSLYSTDSPKTISMREIKTKCILMSIQEKKYIVSLLHG